MAEEPVIKLNKGQTIWQKLSIPYGTIFLHEILKEASKLTTDEEKKKLLDAFIARNQGNETLFRQFVECLCHPGVIFELPAGNPPFVEQKVEDESLADSNLFKELKQIAYVLRCPAMIADQVKRELFFIKMLERLHPNEAKLLLMMKNKKLDGRIYPGLTFRFFTTNYPEYFKGVDLGKN